MHCERQHGGEGGEREPSSGGGNGDASTAGAHELAKQSSGIAGAPRRRSGSDRIALFRLYRKPSQSQNGKALKNKGYKNLCSVYGKHLISVHHSGTVFSSALRTQHQNSRSQAMQATSTFSAALPLYADEALRLEWDILTAEDRHLGQPETAEQQERLEAVLIRLETVEEGLMIEPAQNASDARRKMKILERALNSGAQADQVLRLFDFCRADLEAYSHVSTLD